MSANGRYANAARSYLAAAGSSDDCRSASERLTYVRFLARAGVAFGQSGDYSRALEIMNAAQAQLTALAADDRATSSAAHALLDVIGDAIATINLAARFSM